jgi:hypothetical protein
MAFPYPPIVSPPAQRSEQLARLVYELLDAHADTERLVREGSDEPGWRSHLGYLRDLQRIGRETLAQGASSHHAQPSCLCALGCLRNALRIR